MAQERLQDTSTTLIETTPEAAPTAPPWFGHVLIVLRTVRASALWRPLSRAWRDEALNLAPRPTEPWASLRRFSTFI